MRKLFQILNHSRSLFTMVSLLTVALCSMNHAHAQEAGAITTVAGSDTYGYSGDGGTATSARLNFPERVLVDTNNNVYIADSMNHVIRRVDANTKIIITVAGNGKAGFSGDGGPATAAQLNYPTGMAFDSKGDLYIADRDNNRVRKITLSTGVITTVAGTGDPGFSGDGGPATSAALNKPNGMAFDNLDALFIADTNNGRVRKVVGGTITTVNYRPGPGSDAIPYQCNCSVMDVILDKAMNLYILNSGQGQITVVDHRQGTLGGIGSYYYNYAVSGVSFALDPSGNVILTDGASVFRVSKTSSSTFVIAGSSGNGFSDGNGKAITANLTQPRGVAVASDGTIYVADSGNHLIRKITAISSDTVFYSLRLTAIGGVGVPVNAVGSANRPDIILPADTDAKNIPVTVQGTNIPSGTVVKLLRNDVAVGTQTVDGYGNIPNFSVSAALNPDSGPLAINVLKAVATVTVTPTIFASLPHIKGIRLEKIEIIASLGGTSHTEYLSSDGRRFTLAQLKALSRTGKDG